LKTNFLVFIELYLSCCKELSLIILYLIFMFLAQSNFMRLFKFFSVFALGLVITACGKIWFEKREAWRDEVESRCMKAELVELSPFITRAKPIDGPGACGLNQPLKVSGLITGSVSLKPAATLVCQMIPTLDQWLLEAVQPAAQKWFGMSVIELRTGSYACRNQNNQFGGKNSEHAYGNAMDIFSFTFENRQVVSIATGWNGSSLEQAFLREIFTQACSFFSTVLGPGADAFHYDHFHVDLARHNADFSKRICKPRPETFPTPLITKP
jgi:hypothetical protein